MYFDCYVMCSYNYVLYSFVSLGILIVVYVPFWVFCFIAFFYVLFVCKCVLYYYQRVSKQLQLINIPKYKIYHVVHHVSFLITIVTQTTSPYNNYLLNGRNPLL